MKNILTALFFLIIAAGCNTKSGVTSKDLVGVYTGSIKLDSMPTGTDEASVKTREMLQSIKLTYEFKEDGTGKSSAEMMGMKNDLDVKWALQGNDSLKVNVQGRDEVYQLAKTEKGIDLKAPGATLVLIKQ